MKSMFQIIIIASLFLTGCSLSTVKNPKIINHLEPNYFQDTTALEKAGCTSDGSNHGWNCDPKGQLGLLGCDSIMTIEKVGNFAPSYSIWKCFRHDDVENDQFILRTSCAGFHLFSMGIVLAQDGKYRLLDLRDLSDLKNVIAPIDSGDKALSYLLIANDFYSLIDNLVPKYQIDITEISAFHVEKLEGTHVEHVGNDYLINMYTGYGCGCSQADIYMENILITKAGDINIVDKKLMYTTVFVCAD